MGYLNFSTILFGDFLKSIQDSEKKKARKSKIKMKENKQKLLVGSECKRTVSSTCQRWPVLGSELLIVIEKKKTISYKLDSIA